jgi:hypothetical protein
MYCWGRSLASLLNISQEFIHVITWIKIKDHAGFTVRGRLSLVAKEPLRLKGVDSKGNCEIASVFKVELIEARVKLTHCRTGFFQAGLHESVVLPVKLKHHAITNISIDLVWVEDKPSFTTDLDSVGCLGAQQVQ